MRCPSRLTQRILDPLPKAEVVVVSWAVEVLMYEDARQPRTLAFRPGLSFTYQGPGALGQTFARRCPEPNAVPDLDEPPTHIRAELLQQCSEEPTIMAVLTRDNHHGLLPRSKTGYSLCSHRSPPSAPENHSSPRGASSLASTILRMSSVERAGITEAPSSRRSQTTSSSGRRRLAKVGECVAMRNCVRLLASRRRSTTSSSACGCKPWSISSTQVNAGGSGS